jgi:hypothetical protein
MLNLLPANTKETSQITSNRTVKPPLLQQMHPAAKCHYTFVEPINKGGAIDCRATEETPKRVDAEDTIWTHGRKQQHNAVLLSNLRWLNVIFTYQKPVIIASGWLT